MFIIALVVEVLALLVDTFVPSRPVSPSHCFAIVGREQTQKPCQCKQLQLKQKSAHAHAHVTPQIVKYTNARNPDLNLNSDASLSLNWRLTLDLNLKLDPSLNLDLNLNVDLNLDVNLEVQRI